MKKTMGIGSALLLSGALFGAVYEAEDFVADKTAAAVIAQKEASGGKCVRLQTKERNDKPQESKPAVCWTFKVPEAGKYDLTLRVWMRDGGADSVWLILDNGKPEYTGNSKYKVWQDITKKNIQLTAGEHTVALIPRESGFQVDSLSVTPAAK